MTRSKKTLYTVIAIAAVLAIVVVALLATRGDRPLVVQDGVVYRMISFGSVDIQTKEKATIPCYMVTFTYRRNDGKVIANDVGTISIPRNAPPRIDRSLSLGCVVWDPVRYIEGKPYRTVRWNPRRIDSTTSVPINEREPLRQK